MARARSTNSWIASLPLDILGVQCQEPRRGPQDAVHAGRQGERRHLVEHLPGQGERLAAGGQDRQAGRGGQQRLRELGAGGDEVFAVIENQEQQPASRTNLDSHLARR